MVGSRTILAASRKGFLSVNDSADSSLSQSLLFLKGTGVTFRWPMLLSCGTSRHSGYVSPPDRLLTLLGSPLAVTIMNMHSWPTCVGFHLNGPTVSSAALFVATFGAASCAVVIGSQSFG